MSEIAPTLNILLFLLVVGFTGFLFTLGAIFAAYVTGLFCIAVARKPTKNKEVSDE